MNSRAIPFAPLLLLLLGACSGFDPQAYVPGLEIQTAVTTREPSAQLPIPPAGPSLVSASTQAPMLKVCTNIAGGKLHVRFGPGKSSDVRGYLAEGEIVTVGAGRREWEGSLWVELSHPIEGWVNAGYLCLAE
jgi:hypothetical protein